MPVPVFGAVPAQASWVVAAAMLLGQARPLSLEQTAARGGSRYAESLRAGSALTAAERKDIPRSFGLEELAVLLPPASGAGGLVAAIERRGLLWVDSADLVIYALLGDGSDAHTFMKFVDLVTGASKSETLVQLKTRFTPQSRFIMRPIH